MAGISSVLDIAKGALLTHQLSVQVASNNVANVDTPGYSRQVLNLANRLATPTSVGSIGTGVEAESIMRQYDQILTSRIIEENTTLANFEAQEKTLTIVEAIFNESTGLGLNDLMGQYWQSWQDVANLPENLATRQALLQSGTLVQDYLGNAYSELIKARTDIGNELNVAISEVNRLTEQVADINREIATLEKPGQQMNDLRDTRDNLVGELSTFLDITTYENVRNGAVSVLLADGHTLVDGTESNRIDFNNNQLVWISELNDGRELRAELGEGEEMGGEMGGWLEVHNELIPGDPSNVFGRLESFTRSFIREVNQVHSQGVGMLRFSDDLMGTERAENTAVLTTTVDAALANVDITAGIFEINGREVGTINGGPPANGLAMEKAYNAVNAINVAQEGVVARLTTQVAGGTVVGLAAADVVDFTINGIAVTYTAVGAETANATATAVAAATNAAITVYNADPTTVPDTMTIEAIVGDGTNGGPIDSIIFRNTLPGESSSIVIGGVDPLTTPADANLSFVDGTYEATATQNTGEITLFSNEDIEITAGPDDINLVHLGMAGGLHVDDVANDGEVTYGYEHPGGVAASLLGFEYGDEVVTDGGSFDIWLYDADDMPLLPIPVTVDLDRAYTLHDVASAINTSVTNASGGPAYLTASVRENKLEFLGAVDVQYAFANDTSNILQVAGVNTFFSGYDASTIRVNSVLEANVSFVAAGNIDDDGSIFRGDNENALALNLVQFDETVEFSNGDITTLDGFYNSLVGDLGSRVRMLERNAELHTMISNQLNDMRDSFSGVSLDEELANIIKFQQAYTAAAKLVSTSDEMLETLVNSLRR